MKRIVNPFRPTRWEHQRDGFHLIWFTNEAENLLEDRSFYVNGTRGSGKTTLLKSLHWRELINNISLKLQRDFTEIEKIGIYIRFPDHIGSSTALGGIDEHSDIDANRYYEYFSLLVESICIDKALEAVHELRVKNLLRFNPEAEALIAKELIDEFPGIENFIFGDGPRTLKSLSLCFRHLARNLNSALTRGKLSTLSDNLPHRSPGEILNLIVSRLSEEGEIGSKKAKPQFKFCLDDCEVLHPIQQKSLNTLVRLAKSPIYWIVCYVGNTFDATSTYLPNQALTENDRRLILLDQRAEKDFLRICQQVASLRLFFALPEGIRTAQQINSLEGFFLLKDKFNHASINDIFAAILKDSTRREMSAIKERAQEFDRALKRHKKYVKNKEGRGPNAPLPYYESYLLSLWQGEAEAFAVPRFTQDVDWEKFATELQNKSFEAWMRRKQRAALYQFSALVGKRRLPLYGSNIITSMADGSIRDFLEILGEIFEEFVSKRSDVIDLGSALDRFAISRTPIARSVQTAGIYRASKAYFDGIGTRTERHGDLVSRLIEALGILTARLQSNPADPTALGRAERGIFAVSLPLGDPIIAESLEKAEVRDAREVLQEATLAGYIRMLDVRQERNARAKSGDQNARVIMRFRLHRRLSAHFRFSFRGAYETVHLPLEDLAAICDRSRKVDPLQWADLVATKPGLSILGQLALPFGEWADD